MTTTIIHHIPVSLASKQSKKNIVFIHFTTPDEKCDETFNCVCPDVKETWLMNKTRYTYVFYDAFSDDPVIIKDDSLDDASVIVLCVDIVTEYVTDYVSTNFDTIKKCNDVVIYKGFGNFNRPSFITLDVWPSLSEFISRHSRPLLFDGINKYLGCQSWFRDTIKSFGNCLEDNHLIQKGPTCYFLSVINMFILSETMHRLVIISMNEALLKNPDLFSVINKPLDVETGDEPTMTLATLIYRMIYNTLCIDRPPKGKKLNVAQRFIDHHLRDEPDKEKGGFPDAVLLKILSELGIPTLVHIDDTFYHIIIDKLSSFVNHADFYSVPRTLVTSFSQENVVIFHFPERELKEYIYIFGELFVLCCAGINISGKYISHGLSGLFCSDREFVYDSAYGKFHLMKWTNPVLADVQKIYPGVDRVQTSTAVYIRYRAISEIKKHGERCIAIEKRDV